MLLQQKSFYYVQANEVKASELKLAILTLHMRHAFIGFCLSRLTFTVHCSLLFDSVGNLNIVQPFLQWVVHRGTQQPGISSRQSRPHSYNTFGHCKVRWFRREEQGSQWRPATVKTGRGCKGPCNECLHPPRSGGREGTSRQPTFAFTGAILAVAFVPE